MSTFIKIYGLIIALGYIVAIADRIFIKKNARSFAVNGAIYSAIFHYIVVLFRTFTGNGHDMLSFSFYGKTAQGYIKVAVLLIFVYAINCLLRRLLKDKYDYIVGRTVGWYAVLYLLYVIVINQANMITISVIGLCSVAIALVELFISKNKSESNKGKNKWQALACVLTLYALLFYIVGPSELYAYNSEDFIYAYKDFAPLLIVGSIATVYFATVIISSCTSRIVYNFSVCSIFIYLVATYLQSMFLNGQLNKIDGSVQEWSKGSIIVNAIIWLVIIAAMVAIFAAIKSEKTLELVKIISIILSLVQVVTFVFLILTTNMTSAKTKQLTLDGEFELSKNDNVIIFILDAYDVQMLKMVTDKDPDYLEPLHDFTYYDNMTSMYGATDGCLPYLLTGIETDRADNYESSHFLDDVKGYNYDIKILSERKYVDELRDGIVSNYSDSGRSVLDMDKTMSVFAQTMKYKGMPYLFKFYFKYENYHLTNIITGTNNYIFGSDDIFDDMLLDEGVTDDLDQNGFRIYHLYGAHAPYFLDENGDINYDANDPIAQWRGCLRITYDYIDELKKANLYDCSTVVIMADHGLNRSQRSALDSLGIDYNKDESNPIFIIKKKNQRQDEMVIDSRDVSHEKFFDTIMKCIDENWVNQYNGAVWE